MKIKVFVLTHTYRTSDNNTDTKVEFVASTITRAKSELAKHRELIVGEYEEKFPDDNEVCENHPTFWGITCKDEEVWDELLITEKEVDQ